MIQGLRILSAVLLVNGTIAEECHCCHCDKTFDRGALLSFLPLCRSMQYAERMRGYYIDSSNPIYLKHSTFSRLELPRDSFAGEDGFAFLDTIMYLHLAEFKVR